MPIVTPQEAVEFAIGFQSEGKSAEAEALLRKVVEKVPDYPDALHLLGILSAQKGEFDEAVHLINRAISRDPRQPSFHSNLGRVLSEMGRLDESISSWQRAITLDRDEFDAHFALSWAWERKDELDRAISAGRAAVRIRRGHAQAHLNLGIALSRKGMDAEAIVELQRAIELKANSADAYLTLGAALSRLERWDEAESAYRKAIDIQPDHINAHWNLSLLLLRRGDFAQGWKEFEWGRREGGPVNSHRFPQPQWRGEDIRGKTILLHAEQGIGDTIQFCRYVPQVAARGADVVLLSPPELERLVSFNFGKYSQVLSQYGELFEFHCPLMSLGAIFEAADVPYLKSEPELVEAMRITRARRPSIGLAWAGSVKNPQDARRSIPVSLLSPLASFDADWHSLQKGPVAGDVPSNMQIADHSEQFTDFAHTAALIEQLDLVITVDTAVAHLAGAMGKPTWVLLPTSADWRWFLKRDDSPWYPTMRLFRQTSPGDWPSVIQRVADALRKWSADKSGS